MSGERSTIERTIPAATHGRYLVTPADQTPAPLLVGCHGYSEPADVMLRRLRLIAGSERWTLVAVQALHRFYLRSSEEVVASWMTRQDRELAIADNLAYVASVVDAEWAAHHGSGGLVFAGFSQGVAMAFRAAAASARRVAGVIAVGGDVPPELDRAALSTIGRALVCRGGRDTLYAPDTFARDQARLRDAGVGVTPLEYDGAHEWSPPVLSAAATFLQELAA